MEQSNPGDCANSPGAVDNLSEQVDMTQTTRACLGCGADISHRHGNTRRCERCSASHQRLQGSRNPDESADCFDRNESEACRPGRLRRLRCGKHYRRAWVAGFDLTPPARTCRGCGEVFTPSRWDARHCSRRCTSITYGRKVKRPTQTRNCVECEESFALTRSDRLVCSKRCHSRRGARALLKGFRDFVCAHCSSVFQAIRSDALYCSQRCSRRAYYEANRERLNADSIRWAVEHPEEMRARRRKRRALKRNNPGSVEVELSDWRRLVLRYRGCCAYCGHQPETVQMDHVIPLARGGRHAIGNVLPACSTCNQSKQATLLAEWRLRRKLPLAA